MTQPVWNPPPSPTPGGPTYQQLGTTPRKVWPRKRALWVAVAAFFAGGVLGTAGSTGTTTTPAAAPVPALTVTKVVTVPAPTRVIAPPAPEAKPTTAKPKPAAPRPVTIPGDGTFLVPSDVKPGTYKSTGPSADSPMGACYWARLGDTAGNNILANSFAAGPAVVTIKSTDKAFESQSCNEWTKVA